MDFRAACYCYSQLLQLVCYASRALIIFRFSRNFLGATVTRMSSLSSILLIQNRTNSLIQSRTNDFCASFAYLRAKHCICPRKALHAPMQSFAIANAKLCIRPRKALHVFPPNLYPGRRYALPWAMLLLGFQLRELLFISLKAVPLCSECFR